MNEDEAHGGLPPVTVLVVEDEAIIALDLKRKLEQMGCGAVLTTASADDAIAIAEKAQPDVAILDIGLRGSKDGIDAAAAIHQRFATPIIFASAYRNQADVARANSIGPVGWLPKPFSVAELQPVVEAAIKTKAQ